MNRRTTASVLAVSALLSTILMLSVAYYWPIQERYHPLNSAWNGCSTIANIAHNTKSVPSYDRLLRNGSALLALIGPSLAFSDAEGAQIRSFLETGGTVLLADDFGSGNTLLEAFNLSVRFSNEALADLYYYSKDPRFPIIVDFGSSPVTSKINRIILNHPSYIELGNSSSITTLAYSSHFSFVDVNGQGKPLRNETIDSYPVLASAEIGRGLLVLVADPSMFINEMIGLYDNMQLFRNLLEISNDSLYFDVAHLEAATLTNWRIALRDELKLFDLSFLVPEKNILAISVAAIVTLIFFLKIARLARRERPARQKSTFILTFRPWAFK